MTATTEILSLQRRMSAGNFTDVEECHVAAYLGCAVRESARVFALLGIPAQGQPTGPAWGLDEVIAALVAGRQVQTGTDWNQMIRLAPAVCPPRPVTPAPRFTCPRCGDHRDTTLRGHCDDCEA